MIPSMIRQRIRDFGELVKFSHTVFLLPFALSAVVLAHRVEPVTAGVVGWIVAALVAARTAAMVTNRIADRRVDAANPRTAGRPLITGRVSVAAAWGWLALAVAAFLLACWRLNPLALALSPVALAWVMGYSFSKRFTALCHLWLGSATALAPLGAWIAVTGAWDWRAVVLAGAVALWVAGFDVIYAVQDLEFDRGHGLRSVPARLGLEGALWVSRLMHAGAAAGFFWLAPLFGLGGVYLFGAGLIAAVLAAEQVLVAVRRANIPMAFFTLNGVVSMVFFGFLLADRLAA
jgi:4-hydroxybenzoate polyprenyltransferase